MKKLYCLISAVVVLLPSAIAYSDEMLDMMKQQMQESMSMVCNDATFLNCAGISKDKCSSAVKKSLAACEHLLPTGKAAMEDEAAFKAHEKCIEKQFPTNVGVSTKKLQICDSSTATADSDEPPTTEPPMSREQAMELLNKSLQQQAKAIGTAGVTLPIYKNATVMSHILPGQMPNMVKGVKNLPAMVLASPDSIETIADFYRKNLKGFKEYKVNKGILFLEHGPKNFDSVKDLKILLQTPHVMISPVSPAPGAPADTKHSIEIAYKKKA